MRTDERIEEDFRSLAEATRRGLPPMAHTARALAEGRGGARKGPLARAFARPAYAGAIGLALAGAALLAPVPYTRTVGYELEVEGPGGRVAHLRLPARTEAQARRRAEIVGRETGARVSVRPLTERVWGNVYAMAQEGIVQIRVEMEGKTDDQVGAEIDAQLRAGGYAPGPIEVQRSGDEAHVGFEADDAQGRHVKVIRKAKGDGAGNAVVEIELGAIDHTREPGMTDEQLREKIIAQLKARGVPNPEVVVDGDRVEIRAQKALEGPAPSP
jgi:hypothetical protein